MEQQAKLIATLCACLIAVKSNENYGSAYIEKHPGYHLRGHVIHKMTSSDVWSCVVKCRRTSSCLSLNVYIDSDKLMHCELNNATRSADVENCVGNCSEQYYLELVSDSWRRLD